MIPLCLSVEQAVYDPINYAPDQCLNSCNARTGPDVPSASSLMFISVAQAAAASHVRRSSALRCDGRAFLGRQQVDRPNRSQPPEDKHYTQNLLTKQAPACHWSAQTAKETMMYPWPRTAALGRHALVYIERAFSSPFRRFASAKVRPSAFRRGHTPSLDLRFCAWLFMFTSFK